MTGTTRVRPKEFAKRLGFSVPTLYRRMSTGEIKRPMLDGKCAYWMSDYVESVVKKSSGELILRGVLSNKMSIIFYLKT